MAKKWPFGIPQWFRDTHADLRAQRAAGDVPRSEFAEHAADEIEKRHSAGDPLLRTILIWFVGLYDADTRKKQDDAADELRALEEASGYIKQDLFPAEVLINLGLPDDLDLGGYGKKIATPDARHSDAEKWRNELVRKQKSWDISLAKDMEAADRLLTMLPGDDSKTLRQVVSDPEEYGHGTGGQ